jgi:hypothetical protein
VKLELAGSSVLVWCVKLALWAMCVEYAVGRGVCAAKKLG